MANKNDLDEYSYGGNKGREKGNLFTFFVGIIVFGIGVFLIFQNTTISSNFGLSRMLGFDPPFGLVLLPLIIGIIVLFFNEKSILGWLLVIFGVIFILLGILMGLQISFRRTTLFIAILMYGMTAAGIGITLKGLFGKSK
ncbi:hypothetical protein [Clostridium vincentii]|uniref:Uncharacterized protein n=1 Tax=Clostridium vincentii TaxID=52704 RepID=A0A2T0BHT0_9CLOT|nr:hypothetical protein [Clostridium vincentii]PRR83362.1 hypothetical protein CLVI_09090 [Clostridium vincentii]